MKGAVLEGLFRVAVVIGGLLAFASGVVINGLTGWFASAAVVWAAATHEVSSIPGWLLSTVIVAAAVYLFLLGVALPHFVKTFLFSVQLGLVIAAVVALVTKQWFPALALGVGALLARAVRAGAAANDHTEDREKAHTSSEGS